MGFFDDLGKKVSDAGQKTIQKTKEMSDIAKFNSMITEEEKKIVNNYYQIGKLYVSTRTNYEEAFQGMVENIKESEGRILECRKQIQDIKGVIRCEKCGAEVQKGMPYCTSCGTAMIKNVSAEGILAGEKFCSNCGSRVSENAVFCAECGAKIDV